MKYIFFFRFYLLLSNFVDENFKMGTIFGRGYIKNYDNLLITRWTKTFWWNFESFWRCPGGNSIASLTLHEFFGVTWNFEEYFRNVNKVWRMTKQVLVTVETLDDWKMAEICRSWDENAIFCLEIRFRQLFLSLCVAVMNKRLRNGGFEVK